MDSDAADRTERSDQLDTEFEGGFVTDNLAHCIGASAVGRFQNRLLELISGKGDRAVLLG